MLWKLPLELVDEIISHVDTPRDLGALSAVCRRLKALISPSPDSQLGPLQCCYLSVTINNEPVFQQLVNKPRLAKTVRRLHLIELPAQEDYRPDMAPMQFWRAYPREGDPNREYSPDLLNVALKSMTNVSFLCTDGLKFKSGRGVQHIFTGVPDACVFLTDIFLDLSLEDGQKMERLSFASPLSGISRLRSFRATFNNWAHVPEAIWNAFSRSLFTTIASLCSDLQHIGLTWVDHTLNELFKCTYPRLKSIDIVCDIGWVVPSDTLHLFLKHNPSIEALHFCCITTPFLPRDALPNLKRVKLCPDGGAMWDMVNPMSDGSYRPLEWVDFCTVRPENMSTVVFPNISNFAETMVAARVHRLWSLEEVSRLGTMLPNIHTLAFTHLPTRQKNVKAKEITSQYIHVLATSFPNLRCLKSFFLEHPDSAMSPEVLVQKLGDACPNLLCVDNWVRDAPRQGRLNGWRVDHRRSQMLAWPNFNLRNDDVVHLPEAGLDPATFQRW